MPINSDGEYYANWTTENTTSKSSERIWCEYIAIPDITEGFPPKPIDWSTWTVKEEVETPNSTMRTWMGEPLGKKEKDQSVEKAERELREAANQLVFEPTETLPVFTLSQLDKDHYKCFGKNVGKSVTPEIKKEQHMNTDDFWEEFAFEDSLDEDLVPPHDMTVPPFDPFEKTVLSGYLASGQISKWSAVGSRATCNPPPTDTDADYLVLVEKGDKFNNLLKEAYNLGFRACWGDEYRGLENFYSFRCGVVNLIITKEKEFYDRFLKASHLAKRLNVLNKVDRIALFDIVMGVCETDEPLTHNNPVTGDKVAVVVQDEISNNELEELKKRYEIMADLNTDMAAKLDRYRQDSQSVGTFEYVAKLETLRARVKELEEASAPEISEHATDSSRMSDNDGKPYNAAIYRTPVENPLDDMVHWGYSQDTSEKVFVSMFTSGHKTEMSDEDGDYFTPVHPGNGNSVETLPAVNDLKHYSVDGNDKGKFQESDNSGSDGRLYRYSSMTESILNQLWSGKINNPCLPLTSNPVILDPDQFSRWRDEETCDGK